MRALRAVVTTLAAAATLTLGSPAIAQSPATPVPGVAGDPIQSAATHIAIYDYDSGQTLYCRRCTEPMAPSSMSKIMTMLVVSDQLRAGKIRLDTEFPVSENAWRHGAQSDGSHMFLELNSRVKVSDLMRGVVVVSANDGCIALAEGIAGSELGFVDLMNRRAKQLGLTTARFRNATGLPEPDHVISAQDLTRLSAVLIRDYPELYRHYSERSFTFNNKTQGNRNPILGVAGADGVKTGHTSVAGYGLIGSGVVAGQRRIFVINGLKTQGERSEEAKRIFNIAFSDFSVTTLFAKGAPVGQADVWLGAKKQVPLTAVGPIVVGAHRSIYSNLRATIVYNGPLQAPIKKGDVVAKLVVEGPGVRQEFPLAAGARVGQANPFARAAFGLSRMFGGG